MKLSGDVTWLARLATSAGSTKGRGEVGKTTCGEQQGGALPNAAQNGCVHLQNVETHPCVCHPGIDAAFTVQRGWSGGNGESQKLLRCARTWEGWKMESTPWWEVIKRNKKCTREIMLLKNTAVISVQIPLLRMCKISTPSDEVYPSHKR